MSHNLLIHKDFLRTLPESLTLELQARAVTKRFSDGSVVFRRGDAGHGLFGVRSGRVQVLGRGEGGREFVLTVLAISTCPRRISQRWSAPAARQWAVI